MSSKFDEIENDRKEFLKELNKLSTLEFNLEKWEKLSQNKSRTREE